MDQASEIREKIDIVSFISEFIPLKKAGRNFRANCPFHNEKSPSFMVSPERQIWHCFGCQKGGDAFTFLMEYEHVEFPEALRILAKKTGVELKSFKFDNESYSEKEKIYNLNKQALRFYQYVLLKHSLGKKALSYLTQQRGMNEKLVETFSLGYSPSSGTALSSYLINKKGHKKQDLYLAGLAFENRGRTVDFFRDRLMFPLTDHRGNVVGFSGRILEKKDDVSKYVNTKETPVYHKGNLFFGLDIAKDEIKKQEQAIIVEGEFDAIACFKEGIKNVVAIKGTALTENQVALLSRFTPKVTLCLDMDEAGFEATKRSLPILEKKGLTTTIIVIPDGKDPDESIKNDPSIFKKALKSDVGVYDFLIEKLLKENDKKSVTGKKKISDDILPLLAQISNEIVKEHYLKKLSQEIDISYESINREVEKMNKGEKKEETPVAQVKQRKRREILEEYILALIIQAEDVGEALDTANEALSDFTFETSSFGKIIEFIRGLGKSSQIDGKKISKAVPKELESSFDACFLLPIPSFPNKEIYLDEIRKVGKELAILDLRERLKEVSEKIQQNSGNEDELIKLNKDFENLTSLLSQRKIV